MNAGSEARPVDRAEFAYASCYCEENVWQLAGDARIVGPGFVIFISNRERCCPLWAQRASTSPNAPAIWDYHVIYAAVSPETREVMIYDLDSRLPFPSRSADYFAATFPFYEHLEARLLPYFRVIPAAEFREKFASDRSHMMEHGRWKAPPPAWPAIRTATETMNLDRFIDMRAPFAGEVVELADVERKLIAFAAQAG